MKIIVCSIHLQDMVELSLQTIHDIVTENLGTLCISKSYRPLQIALNADRYESTRQKADLAALVLQDVGVNRHGGKFIVYICSASMGGMISFFFCVCSYFWPWMATFCLRMYVFLVFLVYFKL